MGTFLGDGLVLLEEALSLLLNLSVLPFPCLGFRHNDGAFSQKHYEDQVKYV